MGFQSDMYLQIQYYLQIQNQKLLHSQLTIKTLSLKSNLNCYIMNLKNSKVIVIKIDVQGVNTLKEIFPLSTSIFIAPALKSDLIERLKIRNSENDESIESRVNAAENELALSKNFDHIVINANNLIDTTVKKIQKIIQP